MLQKLEQIREAGLNSIANAADLNELEVIRKDLTGKKSELQEVLKSLGGLEPEMRKSVGMKSNEIKNLFAQKIEEKEADLVSHASAVEGEIDLTLPGIEVPKGALHPITQMCYDLNDAFRSLGFEIYNEDDELVFSGRTDEKGKIVIEYYGNRDLERLLEILDRG